MKQTALKLSKKMMGIAAAIILIFVFFVLHHGKNGEGERRSRVATQNGLTEIVLSENEKAVNGIKTGPPQPLFDKNQPGFFVPGSAVVWNEGKPWIYLEEKEGHFVRREIAQSRLFKNGRVLPQDFFLKDQKIVLQGAQAFLSEEFAGEISEDEE